MLERFGFTGDKLTARIGDLSGGERRRFQLLRLLLTEPNVLLLDEPTNDLDIDTLNVLEDFLDGWPGTLVVVSHDRYFLERVTDSIWALLGDGQISMLPRGVDEYLERRAVTSAGSPPAEPSLVQSPEAREPSLRQPGEGASRQLGGARGPQDDGSDRQAAGADRGAAGGARRRHGSPPHRLREAGRAGQAGRRASGRARAAASWSGWRPPNSWSDGSAPSEPAQVTARPLPNLHE